MTSQIHFIAVTHKEQLGIQNSSHRGLKSKKKNKGRENI
jgi:hypothetical protein